MQNNFRPKVEQWKASALPTLKSILHSKKFREIAFALGVGTYCVVIRRYEAITPNPEYTAQHFLLLCGWAALTVDHIPYFIIPSLLFYFVQFGFCQVPIKKLAL